MKALLAAKKEMESEGKGPEPHRINKEQTNSRK